MADDFVGNDGGVVAHVDFLDCERGDFGEEDASEGV